MKMSAQLVSKKPVFLSRAAKLLSRFASVDNGSSGAVPLYLQRTADAFNHLVQFHSKHKTNDLQTYPVMKRVQNLQRDWENGSPQDDAESRLDEANRKYTKIGQRSDEKTSEIINLENKVPEQEKKEKNKKRRKSRETDGGDEIESEKKEKSKKRRTQVANR